MNYYRPTVVPDATRTGRRALWPGGPVSTRTVDGPQTALGWGVDSDGSGGDPRPRRREHPHAGHRERRRLRRSPTTRIVRDQQRLDYIDQHLRRAPRDRGGRRPARILRLVAARQLRMGSRGTRDGSGSSESTTRCSSARRRKAHAGTARSSLRTGSSRDRLHGPTSRRWRCRRSRGRRCRASSIARPRSALRHGGRRARNPARPAEPRRTKPGDRRTDTIALVICEPESAFADPFLRR